MSGKSIQRIGDLQLRILRVLWDRRSATVAEVLQALEGKHAYTTIATMLRKMEDRGLVTHREQGRKFVYVPAVSNDDVSRGLTNRLIDRLFAGSLAGAVSHFLQSRDVDPAELDELDRLLKDHRRRHASEKPSRSRNPKEARQQETEP